MAPSNSMNRMTRPLRRRPKMRAGFETGVSAAIVDMALSLEIGGACLQDERDQRGTTGGMKIFLGGCEPPSSLLPLWEKEKRKLLRLRAVWCAVAHQAVEMHADVGGFGGRVGERDGAVESDARLLVAAKLHQDRAAH